ncbi:hypothetical protein FACS189429_0030 [Bacteroidia bacterium]|nr:hypothetical protein FACS189429_0030 [Bacteroidia bacterium]
MKKEKELFYYSAVISSAEGYPCEVIHGSSFGSTVIPPGFTDEQWGYSTKSWAVGDEFVPPPDTIYLSYYSYAEDLFYRLKSELPQDTIKQLLAAHYRSSSKVWKEDKTYTTFQLSIAPEGYINVWLMGDAGFIEIAHFRAEKIDLNFKQTFPTWAWDREKSYMEEFNTMFSFVQKEITEKRLSSAYWENLSKRYLWKLTFNNPEIELYNYGVDLINIERYRIDSHGTWLTEMYEKAVPKSVDVWIHSEKQQLNYHIDFELMEEYPKATDGSDKIAEQYAACDKRIKLIYNEINLHIGNSRNRGMEHATGKYIGFTDHDDYCEPEMFECLYQKAESEQLDIACCNYTTDFISEKDIVCKENRPDAKHQFLQKNRQNILKNAFAGKDNSDFFVWDKLFRASFLEKEQLTFVDTKTTRSEDRLFIIQSLFCTQKIDTIAGNFYHWSNHTANTGRTFNAYINIQHNINYCLQLFAILKKSGKEQEFYADFLLGTGASLYSPFLRAATNKTNDSIVDVLSVIKQSETYKQISKTFNIKYISNIFRQKPTISIFLILLKLIPQKI